MSKSWRVANECRKVFEDLACFACSVKKFARDLCNQPVDAKLAGMSKGMTAENVTEKLERAHLSTSTFIVQVCRFVRHITLHGRSVGEMMDVRMRKPEK
jgi:hypothetical protein